MGRFATVRVEARSVKRANPYQLEAFVRLRLKLDGCLTVTRLAKDRAAEAVIKVRTRAALDYPA